MTNAPDTAPPHVLLRMLLHDLRNPLMTLGLALEAMSRGTNDDPPLSTLAGAQYERVVRLFREMEILVADGGPAALRPQRLELETVIADAVEDVQRAFPERSIQLGVRAPVCLTADPSRLRRVFDNLLHNAARHAQDQVWVDVFEHEKHARVVVHDDGRGIGALDPSHIFEANVRGEGSDGSGLGLAIVRMLVERMNGCVRLDERSPYTSFEVQLPTA